MADPLALSLALAAAAIGAVALTRHGRHRKRTYRELAAGREALTAGRRPSLGTLPAPESLRADFERERIIRV
jgi:hypothetical protein